MTAHAGAGWCASSLPWSYWLASVPQAPLPEQLAAQPYDELQVTLVDCPGHASLIRTIIGGAQIIDMMLLVVDVTKGDSIDCRCSMPGIIAAHALTRLQH
jgi:translation elongation factor EF-G